MPDRSSPAVVKNIMQSHGLFPKKRLGQNFLVDHNMLTKIADACAIKPDEYIVEIGPGLGGLTIELAKRSRAVVAIEVDTSLEPILQELTSEYHNIKYLFRDILKVDLETELQKLIGVQNVSPYQVCANIPYNITTPILFQLLENCPNMQSATLMMQKEVGNRLLAKPGSKEYGRLTITTAYYADVELVMNVSRNCFYPKPDVDSVVVKITPQRPKKVLIPQEEVFKNFLRVAFQKRRKQIINITSSFFGLDKVNASQKLQELGLAINLRPEELNIKDIAELINIFAPSPDQ